MAQSIEITIRDASKHLMKSCVHSIGRFSPLAEAAIAQAGGHAAGARWLDACIVSDSGERFDWAHCSIVQGIDQQTQSIIDVPVFQGCSLRLMPDFGGASLWLPDGRNANLNHADFPESDPVLMLDLAVMIDRWQSRFERGCLHGNEPSEPDMFDWPSFQSKAAALALRSVAVLQPPLHVEQPYEWEFAPERAKRGQSSYPDTWWPSWGSNNEMEQGACRMLSELDEAGFVELIKKGARQSKSACMPWSVYCAHMGMREALGVLIERDPSLVDGRCMWSCSALEAALFASDVEAVDLCMRAGAALPKEKSISVVAGLADSALSEGLQSAKECVAAWGSRGGSLEFSKMESKRMSHPLAQEVFSLARAIHERLLIQEGLAASASWASRRAKAL